MSSHEAPLLPPITRVEVENLHAQIIDRVPGEEHPVAPTQEQVRAADEVFARDKESEQVLGILGMWTGALMLHDIMVDTFDVSEEEEEKPSKKEDGE
jgi:hypothetical protein